MGAYVKKTSRRRYDDRQFTVRAVHRDTPDLHKLCDALSRLTLQEVGSHGDDAATRMLSLPIRLARALRDEQGFPRGQHGRHRHSAWTHFTVGCRW